MTLESGLTYVETVNGIGSGLAPGEAAYGGPIDVTWSMNLAYNHLLNLQSPTAPTTDSPNIATTTPLWSGNIDENTPTPTPTPIPTPVPTPKPTPTPVYTTKPCPKCLVTVRSTPAP